MDERAETICRTAHEVKGDQYLTAENRLYEVEEVREDTAHLRLVRQVDLEAAIAPSLFSRITGAIASLFTREEYVRVITGRWRSTIPIRMNPMSPPTGVPVSVGMGSFRIGESLAQTLQERGINILHDKTPHDPHDAMAYDRSRRTAAELLKKNPIALIDLHRDAVPADEYADQINNTAVTKAISGRTAKPAYESQRGLCLPSEGRGG